MVASKIARKSSEKTKVLYARVDEQFHRRVKAAVANRSTTVSDLIEAALREYLRSTK